ncbi:MAG: phenylacetate--CoA ligase [bacterium]|nr:phenylacetate--CoA ligase [bacterium]
MIKEVIAKQPVLERSARLLRSMIPYRYRLDPAFYSFLELLKKHEKVSYEYIREYQFKKLKNLLNLVYEHTFFYKQKYDAADFHAEDVRCIDDMDLIPVVTKEDFRLNCQAMVLDNYYGKKHKISTSGTTGKSLKLLSTREIDSKEWASICYQWDRIGYKAADGRVELRGFIDSDKDWIYLD